MTSTKTWITSLSYGSSLSSWYYFHLLFFFCSFPVQLYGRLLSLSSIGKCLDLWDIMFWWIIASKLSICYVTFFLFFWIYESLEHGNDGTTMQPSFPDLCLLHITLALAYCHLGGVRFPFQMTSWSSTIPCDFRS